MTNDKIQNKPRPSGILKGRGKSQIPNPNENLGFRILDFIGIWDLGFGIFQIVFFVVTLMIFHGWEGWKSLLIAQETSIVEESKSPQEVENLPYKRDPFKPFIKLSLIKEGTSTVPLTPLQRYDIPQFKLIAIIKSAAGNRAMVEDPESKGYIVKEGTLIGKNNGVVAEIEEDKVIVEEKSVDLLGKEKVNRITINLKKREEGG